jgi:L-ascorbate metabolism protein UlaG (beta-lactamase superfamily)
MTDARHSSGYVDNGQMVYLGEAAGFVVGLEDARSVYFAGDTSLFGDMRLIGEIHRPAIAFLPIGDRFTMGPADAARACAMLGCGRWCRCTGHLSDTHRTPAELKSLVPAGVDVLELKPGETAE